MSTKKDMRRNDLVISYVDPVKDKNDGDISSTIDVHEEQVSLSVHQDLMSPIAMTDGDVPDGRMIGWASLVFSLQTWLAETPEQTRKAGTPGYLSVGMALMAIVVTYLPLFLPPPPGRNPGSGTEARAAVPSS